MTSPAADEVAAANLAAGRTNGGATLAI